MSDIDIEPNVGRTVLIIGIALLVIIPGAIIVLGFNNVPAGNKGVYTAGLYQGTVKDEGWVWVNPLSTMELVEYKTQQVTFAGGSGDETASFGEVRAFSMDNVEVTLDFTIVYNLEATHVGEIRIQNGQYLNTVILPVARSVPRDVTALFNATDIRGSKRAEVGQQIENTITIQLAEKYIIVERFDLRGISLPEAYEVAIVDKKVAEQRVLTEGYNLDAQEAIAAKEVVDAQAQASVTVIEAAARATAIQIVIDQFGLQDRAQAVNAYNQWLYIQALSDPNSNINYVMLPLDGGVPVILDGFTSTPSNGTA